MNLATIIMISFLLKDCSYGMDAVLLEWDIIFKGKFDYILRERLEKQKGEWTESSIMSAICWNEDIVLSRLF